MIVLDAAVAIALLDVDDAHHDKAVAIFADSPGEVFVMHPINLAEALVSPARAGRGEEALAALQAFGVATAEIDGGEALTLARLRAAHRLKMPDTCALALALRLDAPLVTFDDRLDRVWGDVRRG